MSAVIAGTAKKTATLHPVDEKERTMEASPAATPVIATSASSLRLSLPAALLGLAGGAHAWFFTVTATPDGPWSTEALFRMLLFGCTTLAALGLGRWLERNCQDAAWRGQVIRSTVVAGVVNGVVAGGLVGLALCAKEPRGIGGGLFLPAALAWLAGCVGAGAVGGLLFVPMLLLLVWHAREALHVRPGALLFPSARRNAWRAAIAGALGLGLLAQALIRRTPVTWFFCFFPLLLGACAIAIAVLAAFLSTDVQTWLRVRRATERMARMVRRLPEAAPRAHAPTETVDVGIGAEQWEDPPPAGDPYRAYDRSPIMMRGNGRLAMRAAARMLLLDAAGLGLAGLLATIAWV